MRVRLLHRSPRVEITRWQCFDDGAAARSERRFPGFVLSLTLGGACTVHSLDRSLVVDAAGLMLSPPGAPYWTEHTFGCGDRGFHLAVPAELGLALLHGVDRRLAAEVEAGRPVPVVRAAVEPRRLLRLGAWLEAELPQGGAAPGQVDDLALDLLRHALNALGPGRRPPPARSSTREQHRRWVEAARSHLLRNLGAEVRLADLARAVHTSPYHLSRVFRAATGMPPHRYLRHLRLAAAVAGLGDDRPLGELALELGYSSASHFSSAFRRELGVAPSDLRRRIRRAARRRLDSAAGTCNTCRGGA